MELSQFLVNAKTSTCASDGEANEQKNPDGSLELTYSEGEFSYRDRYFGLDPFVGQEIVFQDGKAIWSMNYYGHTVDKKYSTEQVYVFLQKAMRQVTLERPFRGPNTYEEGNFMYNDESSGTLESFSGVERILFNGHKVYQLKISRWNDKVAPTKLYSYGDQNGRSETISKEWLGLIQCSQQNPSPTSSASVSRAGRISKRRF